MIKNVHKEINEIKEWIYNKVTTAGKKGCVVGVSGGIDSAVIASVCKEAFPNTTYGIIMPRTKNMTSEKRAKELCEKLKIKYELIEMKNKNLKIPQFYTDSIYGVVALETNKDLQDQIKLAIGNYTARKRMATLYYYAELLDYLVIGTDNKCENYIGYFTKHGDGGVDINPIGQYYKSEVYELGRSLEVPKSILNTAPSAELMDGQTDEQELGMSYAEIEEAIKLLIAKNNNLESTLADSYFYLKPRFKEVLKTVNSLHKKTEHKRIMPEEYKRKIK